MTTVEKISAIESEMAKTQKNKVSDTIRVEIMAWSG